jgi:hypothetical protein
MRPRRPHSSHGSILLLGRAERSIPSARQGRAPVPRRPASGAQPADRLPTGRQRAHGQSPLSQQVSLAIGNEPAVAGAQPDLCLPGDAMLRGEILEPTPQGLADPCRKPVSPRSFDQHPSCSMIAGLRNGPAPHRRNEAEKSHQLLRGRKATNIANSATKVTATRKDTLRRAW